MVVWIKFQRSRQNPKCLFVWVTYGVGTKWSTCKKGQSIKVVQHWRETCNKPIWICYISIDKSHNRWWQMKSDYSKWERDKDNDACVCACVVIQVSWGIELNLLSKNLMLCLQRWIPSSAQVPSVAPVSFSSTWMELNVRVRVPLSLQYPLFSIHLLIGFARTLWQVL